MLTLYRRHSQDCPNCADPYIKKDGKPGCPMWVRGVKDGVPVKYSLKTRSWEAAAEKIKPKPVQGPARPTKAIAEAAEAYEKDVVKRLAPSTYRKHHYLMEAFQDYCRKRFLKTLDQLTTENLREFRHTWADKDRTARKKLERLRSFLKFAIDSGWMEKDPTRSIAIRKAAPAPTLPFSKEEMGKILDACCDSWTLAFVLTLRYTGLRISDVSLLKDSHFDGRRVFLHQTKTGEPVWVPVPPIVADALKRLTPRGGYFFLRGESTKLETVTDLWRRQLKAVFKTAGISGGHPHRFRDTAACEWLMAGVPIEEVATLLGHASIAVTQKSYAPWIRGRQERLEKIIAETFEAPKLQLVKK